MRHMCPLHAVMRFSRRSGRYPSPGVLVLLVLGTQSFGWATPAVGKTLDEYDAELDRERLNPFIRGAPAPDTLAPALLPRRPEKPANDPSKSDPELLLLAVTLNGMPFKEVVRAELLPGGPLLVTAEVWTEARFVTVVQAVRLSDGMPGYALDDVPGLTYQINRQSLSMDINAPASAFVGVVWRLDPNEGLSFPLSPRPGVLVNYDFSISKRPTSGTTDTNVSGGAMLEAVAFSRMGNVVTSALVTSTNKGFKAARLDSFWRYDLPDRMASVVVGDTVGVGGGWSRPARYGGIRWGRDFGMRPGFVTFPQLSFSSEAALPSTVDVLVNNARRLSLPVQPGPFDLTHVPLVSGAGELGLVVRDLLGRETVVRQNYYVSPQLLAPGLTDFSFEAGWLRAGYGRDSVYRDGFGAATWRQGLTHRLSGEVRLELQRQRRAAGFELTSLLGTWGVVRGALAASHGDTQGLHTRGHTMRAGIERSTPAGGGTLQYERSSRDFAPFGESTDPVTVSQRARERWLASFGGLLWANVSGGASYVRQNRWDGDQLQLLGLALNFPVAHRASVSLSVNKRLDGDRSWRAAVTVNLPLGDGITVASGLERGTDNRFSGAVSASRSAPAGPGLGWRVQTSTLPSQRAQADLQYNTNQAEFMMEAVSDASGQVATRAGGRGTVGWLEGMAFATRPVGQGSVAVVRVAGLEGIPVKHSHQVVALTDARGLAFVPGLLPWQKNQIEIDVADLPLDVEAGRTSHQVTPRAMSGVVVDFAVRRTRQALLRLQQPDATPIPVGARVRLLPDGPVFITGRRGEVWLTDLADSEQRLQVSWPTGDCMLKLAVPPNLGGVPATIGPLVCEPGKP